MGSPGNFEREALSVCGELGLYVLWVSQCCVNASRDNTKMNAMVQHFLHVIPHIVIIINGTSTSTVLLKMYR